MLIERSTLRQALDPADITDLFAQIEIDAIKERQPKAADFQSKVLDSGARRLVAVRSSRPGVLGNERVRQYSVPVGTDLYRVTCISSAARFAVYDPVFSHIAASLTFTGIGHQVTQPTKIGRYEVVERVGRGGMGAVYLGRDTVLEREVAIKVMSADFAADETSRPRFYREARAAAKLQHRNIVTIFEFGEEDDTPFIVMEFLRGQDLSKRMRAEPPLTLEQKIDIIAELCTGLHFAHEQGVIHRDVKPANIWLVPDGSVKLLDFGIAKFSSSTMTRQGSVLGSISYMSPEQINGLEVDGRADVFSAGVVLFELLTGKKPFAGESPTAVLARIMDDEPARVEDLPADLPKPLVAAVLKALAEGPGEAISPRRRLRGRPAAGPERRRRLHGVDRHRPRPAGDDGERRRARSGPIDPASHQTRRVDQRAADGDARRAARARRRRDDDESAGSCRSWPWQ